MKRLHQEALIKREPHKRRIMLATMTCLFRYNSVFTNDLVSDALFEEELCILWYNEHTFSSKFTRLIYASLVRAYGFLVNWLVTNICLRLLIYYFLLYYFNSFLPVLGGVVTNVPITNVNMSAKQKSSYCDTFGGERVE